MNTSRGFITSRLDPLEKWRATPPAPDTEPAAVLVPLVERPEGLGVILTLRPQTLRRHAGQIAFPGGRADPGERPWQTALREAHEEIGLNPALVSVAGLVEPFKVGGWFCATPVVGFVPADFEPVPNPDEVAEVFETPFAFLMDAANHREHVVTGPDGVAYRTLAMPWGDRFIWGATAGMLHSLYRRLYGSGEPWSEPARSKTLRSPPA
jgi:8-oxo-dGTP pyrophosphatase MutT (NUDIX family)